MAKKTSEIQKLIEDLPTQEAQLFIDRMKANYLEQTRTGPAKKIAPPVVVSTSTKNPSSPSPSPKKGSVVPKLIRGRTAAEVSQKQESSPIPATIVADPDGIDAAGNPFSWVPDYVGTSHAAELRANVIPDVNGKKTIQIPYRVCARIDCGFSMKMPEGYAAMVSVRKELAARGLVVLDSPAVVDGRVTVLLGNVGKEIININHGDPIAQIYPVAVERFRFEVITPLENVV